MREDDEALASKLIGVASTPVIGLAETLDRGKRPVRTVGDLFFPTQFVVAMIV
jgi:hypothetical protein